MSIWYTPPCTFELCTISISVSIISISLRVIGRDAADVDNICVQSALQWNENFDDGERSSRMSWGQNLCFLLLFVLLEDNEYLVSNFVHVIHALSIFVCIVLDCLSLVKSFLSFPMDDHFLTKNEIVFEGQLCWRIRSMSRSCDSQCECASLDESVDVFAPIGFEDCGSKLLLERSENAFHNRVCLWILYCRWFWFDSIA